MNTPSLLLKGLSDETRLTMMLLVEAEQELCVCEFVTALDLSQPKISRHLARLRADGLMQDRRQGQWVFYRHGNLPHWVQQMLVELNRSQPQLLADALTRLNAMGDRPARVKECCSN